MLDPVIAMDVPSDTVFYKDLPSLIQEVLQTSIEPDELARYSRAELVVTTPSPSAEEWLAARRLYFDALAERLMESHRLVLDWLASSGPANWTTLFETWWPQITEDGLTEIQADLQADKLARVVDGDWAVTQRGRDFLEYLRARSEQEGHTLLGGEHGL